MESDRRPTMAILTESLRRDNHGPLRFFRSIEVVHFYSRAPYQDMAKEEFANAVQYQGFIDLYKRLIKLSPDIIQGSEPFGSRRSFLLSLTALTAARRLRIPLVFPTLENRTLDERLPHLPIIYALAPFLRWYFGYYTRATKHIIALNNGAAANLRAAGVPDAKVIRFPWGFWGVDLAIFYPRHKVPQPVFKSPVILFVGRLDPEKGIRDILDAFSSLTTDHPEWQLVFVGRGMLEEEIKTFRHAHRLVDRIHLLPWIPNRELPAYYSAARVTVYPSVTTKRGDAAGIQGWSEQVGTVILQSMACGTPVVSTTSGSIPEYLHADTGLLVPENDPDALGRALTTIMTDTDLRQHLSKNGLHYIGEHFDAKKNVGKAEEMILSWLKE